MGPQGSHNPENHNMKGNALYSKSEGKIYPRTDHEGPEGEYRYKSTLSLTSAPDGVGGQRHAPAALLLK